jgi:hypothetical protein
MQNDVHELSFMCDDLLKTMDQLQEKAVHFSAIKKESWGNLTQITLPGGGKIGLYQPKHPTTLG